MRLYTNQYLLINTPVLVQNPPDLTATVWSRAYFMAGQGGFPWRTFWHRESEVQTTFA